MASGLKAVPSVSFLVNAISTNFHSIMWSAASPPVRATRAPLPSPSWPLGPISVPPPELTSPKYIREGVVSRTRPVSADANAVKLANTCLISLA